MAVVVHHVLDSSGLPQDGSRTHPGLHRMPILDPTLLHSYWDGILGGLGLGLDFGCSWDWIICVVCAAGICW